MKCSDVIERLFKKASHSPCRFKVAAIGIDYRGRVIDSTTNHPRFSRKGGGIHAEAKLIRRNPRTLKTILIARIGNSGSILPICACQSCRKMARKYGIQIKSVF